MTIQTSKPVSSHLRAGVRALSQTLAQIQARALALALFLATVAGCRQGDPAGLDLSFSSYAQTPVVLTEFRVNDVVLMPGERVVQGLADLNRPHENAGVSVWTMRLDGDGAILFEASWVELLSHRAYHAEIAVPVRQLQRNALDHVEMMPVFGPGGLLVIASDPMPQTGTETEITEITEIHDAGQICAERQPEQDRDYTEDPTELPMLKEILDFDRPAGRGGGCNQGEPVR
ncbi:hypothetical protein [uncultured Cohaesibacter sp.]|uniref:hypothetical protein n=1 Tax=uncultured Cohaesibacter sp. TaxID=1002546 RepID=UPI0029C80A96|nr:hypothetical protein [uncultured Cohaesibacter sp.]